MKDMIVFHFHLLLRLYNWKLSVDWAGIVEADYVQGQLHSFRAHQVKHQPQD